MIGFTKREQQHKDTGCYSVSRRFHTLTLILFFFRFISRFLLICSFFVCLFPFLCTIFARGRLLLSVHYYPHTVVLYLISHTYGYCIHVFIISTDTYKCTYCIRMQYCRYVQYSIDAIDTGPVGHPTAVCTQLLHAVQHSVSSRIQYNCTKHTVLPLNTPLFLLLSPTFSLSFSLFPFLLLFSFSTSPRKKKKRNVAGRREGRQPQPSVLRHFESGMAAERLALLAVTV